MAASGFTPISLYHSTTAAAAPTAGNLVAGELAINITDGKLYYEDNLGVVQLLASKNTTTGNNLTIALTGGAAAPATFNGSAPVTIDYSTVGADQAGTAVALAIALG
jgi:asparagine N-glycosylation enzyme membrane subunit Stt3